VLSIYYATGVVTAACIVFLVVGTVYRWDLMSPGYGRWTRIVGAAALVGIALVTVWDRLSEPMVAFAAVFVGGALAAGFIWAHRLLSRRLFDMSAVADADGNDDDHPRAA